MAKSDPITYLLSLASYHAVVVEEAAEVLESHIVCCLSQSCQHLILIGMYNATRQNFCDNYDINGLEILVRRSSAAEAVADCLQAGQGLQLGRFLVRTYAEERRPLRTASNPAPHATGSVLLAKAAHLRGLGGPPFGLPPDVPPAVS